jgi:hypothetical protein
MYGVGFDLVIGFCEDGIGRPCFTKARTILATSDAVTCSGIFLLEAVWVQNLTQVAAWFKKC